MTYRIFFLVSFLFSFLFASRLEASMVRVIDVIDGHTIVVERAGARENATLAGLAITDEDGARALLQWTVANAWVMLDEQPGGGHFVYRSPDALFVNRELVQRGLARATLPSIEATSHVVVTYLGTTTDPTIDGMRRRSAILLEGAARSRAARGNGSAPTPPRRARPSRRRPAL
jgi:hypothetical protein